MTGFIIGAIIPVADTITVATTLFYKVFCKFGLPQTLIVDAGSEFKEAFMTVTNMLSIHLAVLLPEAHHAQWEHFHQYT